MRTCEVCKGIGVCDMCEGQGKHSWGRATLETCSHCKGTGKCVYCGGTGDAESAIARQVQYGKDIRDV